MSLKTQIIILSSIVFNLIPYTYATTAPKHINSTTAIQDTVLLHINEYRQQHGLSKLKIDNHIVVQAKQHSLDMANHRMSFGHKYFPQRIAKLRSQIKNYNGGAENIAYNYKNGREVVKQWIRSPGHKKNILGNYNLTGIGVVRDKQGKLYYTQIFIRTGQAKVIKKRVFISPFFRMHG